jgi:uncharacterized membrane protein
MKKIKLDMSQAKVVLSREQLMGVFGGGSGSGSGSGGSGSGGTGSGGGPGITCKTTCICPGGHSIPVSIPNCHGTCDDINNVWTVCKENGVIVAIITCAQVCGT